MTSTRTRLARVLYENDKHIGLEVTKQSETEITLMEGDQFYVVAFVRPGEDGHLEVWVPWEERVT